MRKEIIGIILFFLVIFTLISLLSYSPEDPSINNARARGGDIHNIFGPFGAHVGGALIALFGIGAFWLPILLLLLSVQFFGKNPEAVILQRIAGGVLLIITTGSLIAFYSNHLAIFGSRFSSGGIVGIPLKSFLEKYTNTSGGVIILLLLWLIGFILTTGFSLVRFYKRSLGTGTRFGEKLKTFLIKYKERREKNRKRHRAIKAKKVRPPQAITIKAVNPKPIKKVPAPKQEVFEFMKDSSGFKLPSINLLDDFEEGIVVADRKNLQMQSQLLEKKLNDFGVNGKVVTVTPGPVITTFEYEPAPGVKINKIVNLADDLSLTLRATSIRIVAPIPGKAVIG
ncbi:MAG: DNA translocase FtsK 4TM domain-containing protein, partial [Deltaproteobacteria bacterium]|nr:DNA translocase FtsK 4TM domain-containing protein [Deltaproteobacteria bacterium]